MPLPTPNAAEKDSDFMSRCMTSLEGEYPDAEQRLAICLKQKDEPMTAKARSQAQPLMARAPIAPPASAVGEFMVMAGGLQTISCGQGGSDVTVTVQVDRSTAAALEQQRALLASRSAHRPYFDFDHDDKMASFWPEQFAWRDAPAPGVYARGEWSAAGKAAIEGKTYRAFSPRFHVDGIRKNPAHVICYENASLNMGGLVNDPAFKNNLPLWAKAAAPPRQTKPTAATPHNAQPSMTKEQVAALQAQITQLKNDIAELTARSTGSAEDAEAIQAKQADLSEAQRTMETEELRAKNATLEEQLLAQRSKDAKDAVKAAVKRGAIPSRDEALQAAWEKKCTEDVTNIALLAKIHGSPALDRRETQPARLTIQGYQVRASSADVVKEMGALVARQMPGVAYREKAIMAREVAALYAKEITPRLKDGDNIPLAATNTLGTLAATLASIRTLELLAQELPVINSLATSFSDEIVSYGDTLKTRTIGIPSVQTFNTTTGWPTQSDFTTVDVSITYNQFKGVPMRFLSQEITGTVRRLFDEIGPAQAYALGDDMIDYVFALITAANFTNTVTAAGLGTFGRSTVIDMGTALRKRGVPSGAMNRTLVLNSDYFGGLAKDNSIVTLASFRRPEIIEDGVLPNVHGFKVVDAPTLPATAIAAGTLAGFAFSKSALVLATRLSADYVNAIPGAGNGNLQVITTPAGFSANLVQFVDHNNAYAAQRLEVIYGASAGQNNAGQILQAP
jgi:Mu-like prophage I protein